MSTIQNGKVVLGVDTLLKTKNGAAVKTGLSKRHNLTGKQLCTACVVGLFVATGAASVGAQTWTNVSLDNNWGTATNWSTNTVPNSATATVTIGSPATIASPVQDNVSVTVLSLTLNSGSGLVIDNGTHSTIGNGTTGTLANSGVITIDDAGNGTQLNISGAVTLNGDGTINLGQTSSVSNTNNGMSGSGTLTNVNNIIQGYNNYGWTLGGNSIGIVNQTGGKIIANTSGQSLWVDPNSASGVVNTGLMEATNGGNLVLDGNGGGAFVNTDGTNSGTISAVGTGSTVTLTGGAALSNGTLSSSGGGAFYADSGSLANLTNAATFNIDNSATVTLIGTINNTGTINVNDAGNGTRLIIDSAGVTLKGGGTINLGVQPAANTNNAIGSNNTVSVFTNINNTIQGYNNISYTLGSNNLDIVNQASGTIDANTVGQQLWVDPSADKGMVNAGLMEATKGGNLVLTGNGGGAFNNTGGTILATGSGTAGSNTVNSAVSLTNNVAISGGTLSSVGAAQFYADTGSSIANLSNAATINEDNGSRLTLIGTINNTGTINVNDGSSGTVLVIDSAGVTLTGGGTINLGVPYTGSNTTNNAIGSSNGNATVFTNVNNTIQGYNNNSYTLGSNNLDIVNQASGTIDANTAGQQLWVDPSADKGMVNAGLMEATKGGNLVLTGNGGGAFNNTGGTILATGSGTAGSNTVNSAVSLTNNVAISGGTLSSVGAAQFYADTTSSIANLTNAATINDDNGASFTLIGAINNTGTINVNDAGGGTRLVIDSASVTLKGGGTINLGIPYAGGNTANNAIISSSSNTTVFTNVDNTIQGYNTNSYTLGSNNLDIVNQASGIIDANTAGQQLWVDPSADKGMVNAGLMEATNGGNLVLTGNGGGAFNNTGGTILATGSGTVGINTVNSAVSITNGAAISGGTLTSATGQEIDVQNASLAGVTISAGSNLKVINNNNMLFTSTTITNNGTITVNDTAANADTGIGISGAVLLTGTGTTILNDTAGNPSTARFFDNGSSNLTLDTHATIAGAGGIETSVFTNNGTVNANSNGNILDLAPTTLNNTNVLEASNGGILQVNNGATTGGTIAADGGTVQLIGGSIANAAITGTTGGVITEQNGTSLAGVTISAGSNLKVINNNNMLFTSTTITNNGTITVNDTAANADTGIGISGAVLLTGTGTTILNDTAGNPSTARFFDNGSSNLTLDTHATIAGAGGIETSVFTNNGTVNANSSGNILDLAPTTLNNTNVLEASNGGILQVNNGATTGGTIAADGGTVQLIGGSIANAAITGTTGGVITEQNGTSLAGVTISAGSNLKVINNNNMLFTSTTITNNGTITVNDTAANADTGIGISGAVLLTGTGTTILNDTAGNPSTARFFDNGSSNLTLDTHATIAGAGGIETGVFTNNGTVNANSSGNMLLVQSNGGAYTNNGTFEATNGGTLNVSNLTNYSSGTLTGGIYKAIDSGTGATLVLNDGNITTNAADVTISGVNSTFAQINTLAVNQGEFRVLNNRNFTAQAGFNNQGGLLQLGGGTFAITSGSFTNEGTVQGFGTVTPLVYNTGLIEATGGTLSLSNGALDAAMNNATLKSDAGATLDLSGGTTSSTTLYLVNNGNLNLGNNNVTVSTDYTNANFGVGNSFNPHANVSTTGGKILAGGNVNMGLGISNLVGGGQHLTMDFGQIHSNTTENLSYIIRNNGTTGPVLRGAIQTAVNGGNITDSRLSGAGVTAQNFSPIALSSSTGSFGVEFNPGGVGGSLTGQSLNIQSNFDNVGPASINITGTAYNLAQPSATPQIITFADVHVNGTDSQNISVSNNAPVSAFTETLSGSLSAGTGNATTNTGSFSGLAGGATLSPANTLTVGLDTSVAGARSGGATLSLTSNPVAGETLAATTLTPVTISASGNVYRLANPVLTTPASTTINLGIIHVNDAGTANVTYTNNVPNDNFSENLDVATSSITGDGFANIPASPVIITPNTSNGAGSIAVGVTTATAGVKSGTVQLSLTSDGTGIDTLGKTSLGTQTFNVSATVNNYAAPVVQLESGSSGSVVLTEVNATHYTVSFGNVLQNSGSLLADLGFLNNATGPADNLGGTFDTTGLTGSLSGNGFSAFNGIAAGNSATGQSVDLSTAVAGLINGSFILDPLSQNSSGYDASLSPITVSVSGDVLQSNVPEPSALALLAIGGLGLIARRRKTA